MSKETKHIISLMAIGIGFLIELKGVGLVASSHGDHGLIIRGVVYIIVGLAIAVPAFIHHRLYQADQGKWLPPQGKIDVETLSKLSDSPEAKHIRPRE